MNNLFKNSLIFFSLFSILSCGEKSSDSASSSNLEITYEIDTVMVDAGDHFFFVKFGLSMSDVDKARKLFYNFNSQEMTMEIIDLENLNLKELRQYEKEGPNGIGGGFIMRIKVLPDESVLFYDFEGIHHVAPNGDKIATYKIEEMDWEGDELSEKQFINIPSLDTKDGNYFYGQYGTQGIEGKTAGLVQIDLSKNSLKLFPSDFLDFSNAYDISFDMGGGRSAKIPEKNLVRLVNDEVVIITSAKNSLWRWDLEGDSLINHSYQSQLTSNSKKGNFPMTTGSNDEFRAAMKEKSKEVNFGPLTEDSDQNVLWRYHKEMDRLTAGDTIIFKSILTAFDTDFRQLAESRMPEKFKLSDPIFYLDGMLWQFLNIDDEVAFVRVKPTLK
jgi:hypothetical protein